MGFNEISTRCFGSAKFYLLWYCFNPMLDCVFLCKHLYTDAQFSACQGCWILTDVRYVYECTLTVGDVAEQNVHFLRNKIVP